MPTYAQVRKNLKTGDVVLFSGRGPISRLIQLFSRSPWSHVGMVVHLPEFDTVMLWESTTLASNKGNMIGKTRGVHLVQLSEVLAGYTGKVAVRHLDVHRTERMLKSLAALRRVLVGRPYERSLWQLLRAAVDWLPSTWNKGDLSSVFCSEMVAAAFQAMEILPHSPPANEYTPADFASPKLLPWISGARLLPEVHLALR